MSEKNIEEKPDYETPFERPSYLPKLTKDERRKFRRRRPKAVIIPHPSQVAATEERRASGALEVQPHGGALMRGNKKNKGNTLQSKDVRQAMMEVLYTHMPEVIAVLKNPRARDADKIRAFDTLARYGLGTRQELTGADGANLGGVLVIREGEAPTLNGQEVVDGEFDEIIVNTDG